MAKFVPWDGHDTEQHDDTNAVGKRKVHLIILTKTAVGKDTLGAVGKFRGEAGPDAQAGQVRISTDLSTKRCIAFHDGRRHSALSQN